MASFAAREKVFPETYKQIDVRSKERVQERTATRADHLKKVISKGVQSPVRIKVTAKRRESSTEAKVAVSEKRQDLVVEVPKVLPTKKTHQQLASAVLAIFEVSLLEKGKEKQRDVFTRLLLDLLNRW